MSTTTNQTKEKDIFIDVLCSKKKSSFDLNTKKQNEIVNNSDGDYYKKNFQHFLKYYFNIIKTYFKIFFIYYLKKYFKLYFFIL